MLLVKFLIVFILVFIITNSYAQLNWELAKEKAGIIVYTKYINTVTGLKQFKTYTTFSGVSLHTFFSVFKDIDNANKWTCRLKRSISLKEISETEYYNYFEVSAPWPLRNRDVIFYVTAYQDKSDHSLNIISRVAPDYLPASDTNVRILNAYGAWKFTPIGNGHTRVQTHLYADPRGFPVWIVNLFAVDGPMETLNQLRERVKLDQYKVKKYNFIEE